MSRTLLTDEEFLARPKTAGKQELIDRQLVALPASKHSHDELGKRIAALFQTVLDASHVWIESAYQLAPRQWLQPDVSVT